MTHFITPVVYALCEPGTETIRYIGKTDCLQCRLISHRKRVQEVWRKTPIYVWLRAIAPAQPSVMTLGEYATSEEAFIAEDQWIADYRSAHANLLNVMDGGFGGVSGWQQTEDAKSRISAANKGRVVTPEEAERIGALYRGKTRSEESRIRMSVAHKGKPWTEAQYAAATPKSREELVAASAAGIHKRWHVNRDRVEPTCLLCSIGGVGGV